MNDRLEGIVLKQSEYRENDALLSVFFREAGKLTLTAKGILKESSRNRAQAAPFACVCFDFDYLPERTIFTMKTGMVIESHYRIRENLLSLSAAQVMTEIVEMIAQPQEALPQLYDALRFSLQMLHEGKDAKLLLAYFLAQVLKEMGLEPNVDECVLCGDRSVSTISIAEGGFVCRHCAANTETLAVDLEALKMFRYLNKANQQHFSRLEKCLVVRLQDVKIFVDFLMRHSGLKLESWRFFEDCAS